MSRPESANEARDRDRELVERILAGSREHLDLLCETHLPRVYRFALKRLGDPAEAEELAEAVFFSLTTGLASFEFEVSLRVWIFLLTRNQVHRRLERRRTARAHAAAARRVGTI